MLRSRLGTKTPSNTAATGRSAVGAARRGQEEKKTGDEERDGGAGEREMRRKLKERLMGGDRAKGEPGGRRHDYDKPTACVVKGR